MKKKIVYFDLTLRVGLSYASALRSYSTSTRIPVELRPHPCGQHRSKPHVRTSPKWCFLMWIRTACPSSPRGSWGTEPRQIVVILSRDGVCLLALHSVI